MSTQLSACARWAVRVLARSALLAVVMPFLLVPASPVYACTCARVRPTADEFFARAAVVFTGVPHSIERVVSDDPQVARWRLVSVTFEVHAVEKGPEATQLVVRTPEFAESCGASFLRRRTYRIYAGQGQDGSLGVGSCGGHELLSTGLSFGATPLSLPPPRPPGPPGELVFAVFIGGLLATGGALIWLLFRSVGRQLD